MFSQGPVFLSGDHKAYQGQMDDQEPELYRSAKTFFGDFSTPKPHGKNFIRELPSAEWNRRKHYEPQTPMQCYQAGDIKLLFA